MSNIEVYDHKNITYRVAFEFARIQTDAFKDDPIMLSLIPEKDRYGKSFWPPTADVEQLQAMLSRYEQIVKATARRFNQHVHSDPRIRIMLMRSDTRKLVAGTFWVLPKYLELPPLSLWERIANFFRGLYYRLLDTLAFGRNPYRTSELFAEINWGKKKTGALDSEEREKELMDSNPKQLRETSYPKNLTYYLNLLAVRSDEHGKGYGRQILEGSLAKLAPYQRPPHIFGPPKASLMSAPPARGFYLKCGWEIGAVAEHFLEDGTHSPHTFYFKNLD